MSAEARLWQIVEEAARAVTDPITGRFEQKKFEDELRRRLASDDLTPDVRAVTLDEFAKRLATSFVDRRKPKPRSRGAMFHAGAVLPLGDGKRVWMDSATDTDLVAWAALESSNAARVLAAAGRRQEYVATRLDAMRAHPGWLLGRIERELFDYIEDDSPADDEYGDGDQ